jgi:2-aminoadipate transaminase
MDAVKTINYDAMLSTKAKVELPASRLGARRAPGTYSYLYQFGGGFPDPETYPFKELTAATEAMLAQEGRDAMNYGAPAGYQGLRELVGAKFRHFQGFDVSPDNVLIANGSSHAIALAAELLVDPGDAVIVEEPTFSGTLYSFRHFRPQLIGVPLDAEGLRTDVLEEKLKELARQGRKAKLIYTIVNFQNPAGMTLSLRRRIELLDLADKYDTMILEDDAYGELRFAGEQVRSLFGLDTNGRVMHSGTLSKILGPGTRLGWLLAPKDLIPKLIGLKLDGGTNPYMSRLATYYMREHMVEHVEVLRGVYQRKSSMMVERLNAGLGDSIEFFKPEGGFFIWIRLPEGTDPMKLIELAGERRIGYVPGPSFFTDAVSGSNYIRLAYSFASVEEIREGTDLLCEAIKLAR